MIQVMYEYEGIWPDTESVKVGGQFSGGKLLAQYQKSRLRMPSDEPKII